VNTFASGAGRAGEDSSIGRNTIDTEFTGTHVYGRPGPGSLWQLSVRRGIIVAIWCSLNVAVDTPRRCGRAPAFTGNGGVREKKVKLLKSEAEGFEMEASLPLPLL